MKVHPASLGTGFYENCTPQIIQFHFWFYNENRKMALIKYHKLIIYIKNTSGIKRVQKYL